MSYNERMRKYWLEVAEHTCQYEWYTEEHGFTQCKENARHVHHIIPEGLTLEEGGDPHQNVALPLCEAHHVRNTKEDAEWEEDFSFHPDVGHAYLHYREWKAQEQHLNSISGKKTIDYSTSPFAAVANEHDQKTVEGERYVAGDDDIDLYYITKMIDLAVRYNTLTEEKPPKVKPHKDYDPDKKKRWTDIYYGKRRYRADQES